MNKSNLRVGAFSHVWHIQLFGSAAGSSQRNEMMGTPKEYCEQEKCYRAARLEKV